MTVLDSPGRIGAERQENAPVIPERSASPFPQNQMRRRLSLPGLAWQQVRRAPATICYLAVVWVAGLVTGSIAHGPPRWLSRYVGAGLPSLGHGYWWTPLSAGLWASGLGSYLAVTVLGLVILAPAEHRVGVTPHVHHAAGQPGRRPAAGRRADQAGRAGPRAVAQRPDRRDGRRRSARRARRRFRAELHAHPAVAPAAAVAADRRGHDQRTVPRAPGAGRAGMRRGGRLRRWR